MFSTRGRPRKEGIRKPSGDLRIRHDEDIGTPEIQHIRERLVGDAEDKRASYPLGVLYARRLILQGDHYAGRRYAALFAQAVRPVVIPTVLQSLIARGGLPLAMTALSEAADEERGADRRAQYLAAREVIEKIGEHVARAVDAVCVYEEWAPVIRALDGRATRFVRNLTDGLNALSEHFEAEDKVRRAA